MIEAVPRRPPRGGLQTAGWLVAIALGLAGLLRVAQHGPRAGREAPDFQATIVANGRELGGNTVSFNLRDLRGHAVLLAFWATWCGPCGIEAPILDSIARRWRDRGVVVVGISTDLRGQGDPGGFAAARGLTYPIVQDFSGDVQRAYDVDRLPTLVAVSPTGRIVAVRTGLTGRGEMDGLLTQALEPESSAAPADTPSGADHGPKK